MDDINMKLVIHHCEYFIDSDGGPRSYFGGIPTEDLVKGLRRLGTDQDVLEMFQYLGSANTLELFVDHHMPHNVDSPHPVLFLTDVPVNDDENAQHPQSHDYNEANSEDKENDDSSDSDFLASTEDEDDPTDDDIMFDGNVEKEPNGEGGNAFEEYVMNDEDSFEEELLTHEGSDDEGNGKPKNLEFRPEFDKANFEFKIGMLFNNAIEFKDAVREYAVKGGYDVKFTKSETWKVQVSCSDGCEWRLYASNMSGENTLQIKTYKPTHTCNRSYKSRQVTSAFLASKYMNKFRTTPTWKINEFKDTVKDDCVVEISKMKCYRARKQALVQLDGTNAEQYTKLWDYAAELIRTNPGSRVDINVWRPQLQIKARSQRMFLCLDGIRRVFLAGVRPLIGLDAFHLKGPCQGQLFAVVGWDGNNMMYPIAYAMGLVPTLKELCPEGHYRFCVKHLYANFKKEFRGKELKSCVWKAAKAYTRAD
ncbi:uncharacterized protein LOC114256842 [Camellia sinensis]|uniref:uncharacterized protein LOC114256842 n=1 Tax=Camellia sinensis TaxID=4442 RepID=UPI001036C191|nr:uncharacterized protein LOC114256842 [Camellia sinensis]